MAPSSAYLTAAATAAEMERLTPELPIENVMASEAWPSQYDTGMCTLLVLQANLGLRPRLTDFSNENRMKRRNFF
jgi:hypothetical protein